MKGTLLIIGPTPPPYNGMSVATGLVLKAVKDVYPYSHFDTADRRDVSNMGVLDLQNILLAGYHGLKFLWCLLRKRPDIVYLSIAQNNLGFLRDCLFLIPARLLGTKVVIHLHGGHFGEFYRSSSPAMRGIIRFALAKTSRAIVLGNCLSSVFEGILPNERVRVVPNGLEDRFTSAMNSASKDRRSAVMLFLSTLMEEKGTLDVLKALPAITERVPRVRVVFAGKWYRDSDRQTAEQLVRDLRLESHVEFVGAVAGSFKYDLIRNSSFLLFPTKYPFEGHPFVILEAMSAGIPVISTRWACIPEMLEDAVNGFLIEPGDVRGIAEKSVQLLTDEGLCHRMGEANRERFLRQFLFERFAERIQGVFAEVLERQPIAGELEREVESV